MEVKDQKIFKLEYEVNRLELTTIEARRYSLKNNISIPKDTSYGSVTVATGETEGSASTEEVSSKSSAAEVFKNTRTTICKFICDNMNIDIQEDYICAAHELHKSNQDVVAPLVRFPTHCREAGCHGY